MGCNMIAKIIASFMSCFLKKNQVKPYKVE